MLVFLCLWWFLLVEYGEAAASMSKNGTTAAFLDSRIKWIILCSVLAVGLSVVVVVIATVCCCKKKKKSEEDKEPMNKLRILESGYRMEFGGGGEKTDLLANHPDQGHVLFSKRQEILGQGDHSLLESSINSEGSNIETAIGEDPLSMEEEKPRHQKTVATYTVEYWMTNSPRVLEEEEQPPLEQLAPQPETAQINEAPFGYSRDDRDPRLKLFLIEETQIPLEKSKEMEAQAKEAVLAESRAQQELYPS